MSTVQKQLSVVWLTALLVFFAGTSLYGAESAGTRNVSYLDSSDHVHLLSSTSTGWTDADLTALTDAPVALSGSALTSIVDTSGDVHVYYLGTNHQVYELHGAGTAWSLDDPSSITGATEAISGSALTSFVDDSSGSSIIHVFYQGTDQNVYELYYTTAWHSDSPTKLAGVPSDALPASGSSLTSFLYYFNNGTSDFWGMQVFYLGANQQVYQLNYASSYWSYDVPTVIIHAPVAATGSKLTSFVDNSSTNPPIAHVFYLGTNQNVYELYYTGSWHSDDPTSIAGAPVAVSGSALTSFLNNSGVGDTGMHVMYHGTNEHAYDLYWKSGKTWSYFDATAASGGVLAASGSAMTSFQDLAGGVRLYFLGTNSHVYELYWASEGTATETDLIAASGGTIAAGGSALTSVIAP